MKVEATTVSKEQQIWEDVWVYTQCHRCQAECGVRAHRVNGVVVKLEGVPDSSVGSGGGLHTSSIALLTVPDVCLGHAAGAGAAATPPHRASLPFFVHTCFVDVHTCFVD